MPTAAEYRVFNQHDAHGNVKQLMYFIFLQLFI